MEGQLFGLVSWFNEAKGYGEIVTESNGIFFFTFRELVAQGSNLKKRKNIKKNALVKFTPGRRICFQLPVAERISETKAQLDLAFPLKNSWEANL